MCGIAGLVLAEPPRPGAPPLAALARALAARLAHRGPDGEGFHLGDAPLGPGRAARPVALAHRRLAIIDRSPDAAEPFLSEDGAVLLVFNGEIYNHRALRERLLALGHRFRSRCDAEVIVHLYEEKGPACVDDLRGMFAFAVLDTRRGELFLARDPAGKKPLHYAELPGGGLAFASEIASLLELDLPRTLDRAALDDYLTLGYVPAPRTAFLAIRKLPPAGTLLYRGGAATTGRSLSPHSTLGVGPNINRTSESRGQAWPGDVQDRGEGGPVAALGPRAAARALRAAVIDAVRARLESDVPLGALLSGGVDSTIVTAVLARLLRAAGAPPLSTFSIGFAEARWNEAPFAELAAARIGTEHHLRTLGPEAARAAPDVILAHGEPFADESAVATWHLARFARERVTVVLTGDGGDELFLGYRHQRAARAFAALDRLVPSALLRALAALAPRGGAERSPRRQLGRLLAAAGLPPEERYLLWSGIFPERGADAAERLRRLGIEGHDLEVYLPDDILAKVDRATMAHGLEARAPLLDRHVIALARSLRPALSSRVPWEGKRVLKAAFADLLPPEIARRPKMGFGVPVGAWLRGPLRPLARDLLGSERARGRGLVDPDLGTRLLDEHERGRDHGRRLWTLLMLELWFLQLVDPPRPARIDW